MRFFTIDLLQKLNSKDEDEAEDADEEWDRRLHAYQESIKKRGAALPKDLIGIDLHDAKLETLCFETKLFDNQPRSELTIKCKLNNQIVVLKYSDVKKTCFDNLKKQHEGVFIFSKDPCSDWLIDEISQVDESTFRHEIVFDNGDLVLCEFGDFCFWETAENRETGIPS